MYSTDSTGDAKLEAYPAVAQLVDNLSVGGAEQLAIRIANGRAQRGRPSFLYVLRDGGPLAEKIDPLVGVRYLGVHRASISNPFRFISSLYNGHKILAEQLREDGVSIVQSHLTNPNFWGLMLAMTGAAISFPTIHNNQEFQYGSQGIKNSWRRIAYKLMLSKSGAVVACSDEVRASLIQELGLKEDPGLKLVSVPNGVDLPVPVSEAEKTEIRREFGVDKSSPLVVGAGRLTDQKNFQFLISATPLIKEKVPDFKVVIGGDGELRPELESQIATMGLTDTIHLPGNIMKLPALLQAADVFTLPSKFEGLPLILLEAMASGLPSVCSKIKGTDEVIEDGSTGALVALNNVETYSTAIVKLLQDESARLAMGQAARQRVESKFSFDRVLQQLETLYIQVTGQTSDS